RRSPQHAVGARPDRSVPDHDPSGRLGAGQAPVPGGKRGEALAPRRCQHDEHRGHDRGLRAGADLALIGTEAGLSAEEEHAVTNDPSRPWDAARGYANVNNLTMYYEIHGEGRPLVLLPGAMGTIESCFANLMPMLARTRRVIAAELQGHGRTPDVDRPLSYEQMGDDLAGLLLALDIDVADFVGYSMGGAAAFQLALRHPSMVRRLVVAGGTCYRPRGVHPQKEAGCRSPPPPGPARAPRHPAPPRRGPRPAPGPPPPRPAGQP